MSSFAQLQDQGQSFWLDSLSRQLLEDGSLADRIRGQGLAGITSSPAIFAKAMADSPGYDSRIRVALETTRENEKVYVALAVADVRDACDLLLPVYRASDGADGFVSLEVSPHLAYDPIGTISQARALWDAVGRPNLLVKVPGTRPGLQATEILLYEGINVNVTLLFGLDAYKETLHAYLSAMERRLHEAGAIDSDPLSLRRLDSDLEGHPTPKNPWVPVATGSLGEGLSVANGLALADRMDGIEARIFCLLGDGECSEGAVWEAAQFAADNRLERVVAIVDVNGLEQSGPVPYGHDTSVLASRFRAFGWRVLQIDGHDLGQILLALEQIREPGPTAILARTLKGKGVSFLEGKEGWHGKILTEAECAWALDEIAAPDAGVKVEPRRVLVGSLGPSSQPTGLIVDCAKGAQVATRQAFGNALKRLGSQVDDLVVLDGDVKNLTKTEDFAQAFPARFIEARIAEQNMVGMALGLSASGKRPCVATFAAFLTRAYDFIRMGAHSRLQHLLICCSHAGVSIGEDGPSQMGLEDIAMFRALDGTTVLYPCDAVSAERLTETGLGQPGIVYLRTTRGATPVIYDRSELFPVGGSKTLAESASDRLTLVAAGITVHAALEAHHRLLDRGLPTRVIDAYSVKPLDVETLERAARETEGSLVVEDHNREGGLGEAVAARVGRLGRVFQLGVSGTPRPAKPEELMERHRLSSTAIEHEALAIAA